MQSNVYRCETLRMSLIKDICLKEVLEQVCVLQELKYCQAKQACNWFKTQLLDTCSFIQYSLCNL